MCLVVTVLDLSSLPPKSKNIRIHVLTSNDTTNDEKNAQELSTLSVFFRPKKEYRQQKEERSREEDRLEAGNQIGSKEI